MTAEKKTQGYIAQNIVYIHYGFWRGLQARFIGKRWSVSFLEARGWEWRKDSFMGHKWTNGFRSYSAVMWAIPQIKD